MNDSNLIALAERLLALYDTHEILSDEATYTKAFMSLIGDFQDALSQVE